eukprot:CAMPEP_0173207292 /NCGR_PEP_ID=MMETSP1141-20130122/21848_1 /TAXON_ID=483371 /ORGANISM="non described non described, Strain CCMP2298" /LENGTH=133 /DNA_ID=CAMNT_0014133553 /DNA_START=151 /DNA_END=549 /DNA_ORIENTATION=+
MFPSIPGKKNTGFGHTNSSVNPGQRLSGKTAEKERKKLNRRNYNSSKKNEKASASPQDRFPRILPMGGSTQPMEENLAVSSLSLNPAAPSVQLVIGMGSSSSDSEVQQSPDCKKSRGPNNQSLEEELHEEGGG